jgi:hypothetical protein
MKTLIKSLTLSATLMVLLSTGSGCDTCQNGYRTETITVSQNDWVPAFNTAFSGLSLRLNNFTPVAHTYDERDEYAFYHPNDSSLNFDALPLHVPFDIPVHHVETYAVYINDWRSIGVGVESRSRRAAVSIFFEGEDTEIIGKCVSWECKICNVDMRVDLDEMVVEVLVDFGVRGGRVVIEDMQVEMRSTFEETGPCVNNICGIECPPGPERESEMRAAIEEQFLTFLRRNEILLEQFFREQLEDFGVTGEVIYAEVDPHGDLFFIVKHEDATCA